MPESLGLDPLSVPYCDEWLNELPQDLYPWSMPARYYLGTANGCQSQGAGFFYALREGSPDRVHLTKRAIFRNELEIARDRKRMPQVRTALYRLRSSTGDLLYVGISGTPFRRWVEHSVDKGWWPEVTDCSVEWFESRPAALLAEAAAIRTEHPTYNVVHNNGASA
ncbi:hypothetical protein ACWGLG_16245 [Streptomyces antimycoticus]